MSGFHNILNKVIPFPMDEQQQLFSDELANWMGDNPQMDDVLIMGFEYT